MYKYYCMHRRLILFKSFTKTYLIDRNAAIKMLYLKYASTVNVNLL